MPSGNRVISWGHVVDGVVAACVRRRIRALYHYMPTMHPGMNVALHWNDFRILPGLLDRGSSRWLRLVPRDVAGHGVRQRVNVMGSLIAGGHLESLACIQRHHMW